MGSKRLTTQWPYAKKKKLKLTRIERFEKEKEKLKLHTITYIFLSDIRCQVEAVIKFQIEEMYVHTLY